MGRAPDRGLHLGALQAAARCARCERVPGVLHPRLVGRIRPVEVLVIVARADIARLLLGEIVVVLVAGRRQGLRAVVVAKVLLGGGLALPVARRRYLLLVRSLRVLSAMAIPYPDAA